MRMIEPAWSCISCARSFWPRSPVVTKSVPSGANTSREPKWRVTLVFFAIEKMTSTSSRRGEPPSRTSFARATAVPAPPLPGSEKLKKTRLELAKSGAAAMSSKPPWPRAATFGTPAMGSDNSPPERSRMLPGTFRHDRVAVRQEIQAPGVLQAIRDDLGFDRNGLGLEHGRLCESGTGRQWDSGEERGEYVDLVHGTDVGRPPSRATHSTARSVHMLSQIVERGLWAHAAA